ncbi:hypothetical protein GCM10022226_17850 [Sphaerisporangium flaviroseum]|uniref:GtrA/DPMS transmembrane domain-containing protein n=1 Tax=Sphaerisporangium flaviroseum TaxID=509199 RepID=A0ABP7HPJ3_9ACTN
MRTLVADGAGRIASLTCMLGRRHVMYLAGSGITAAVYYGVLGASLAAGGGLPYPLLILLTHLTTSVIVYPWYRLMVFRAGAGSWLASWLRFYAAGLTFLATSLTGVPLLVEFLELPIMVAQGVIITVSPPLSYLLHRSWTFPERGRPGLGNVWRPLRQRRPVDRPLNPPLA